VTDGDGGAEEREIDLVLEAVRRTSGIELRHYARSTLRRRIDEVVRAERSPTGSPSARSRRGIRRWRRASSPRCA